LLACLDFETLFDKFHHLSNEPYKIVRFENISPSYEARSLDLMTKFSISPFLCNEISLVASAVNSDMAKRDALGKYKGSFLGVFWSLLTPVFMLAIYTFVFSEIFKARWTATSTSKTEFAIVLFAGMIMFNFFAEIVNRLLVDFK
jgi:hypothetical protein